MADGNEVLSVDQLKPMASTASVTSYGLAKVMTDEQLDAYMNLGKDVPFEFTNISRYIKEFAVDGAEEPDGIYVVTVQQAIRYLGNISGGGSGGGAVTQVA